MELSSTVVAVSVLVDVGPASLPGGGAVLEEVFCSVSLQAGEEPPVPTGGHGEELWAPLGSSLPSHACATHTGVDGCFSLFCRFEIPLH